jgi:DHA1 family tetracycline resistance protein-like MFS transporter
MTKAISRTHRQAALGFIFVTACLDVLSLGVMIPVLPELMKRFNGGDTASTALWVVLFATTWGVMQFFCAPILGMMSDRWGRRPVILTSIFGLGVDFLFMAFAPTLWWLFVGRVFNGMTAASFSTAGAYVADVTKPEDRAKGFGLMGAAFGVGFTFGPALGGWLWQFDHRLPFLVCAGLALCNWLYGFFVLPESLPPERRVQKLRLEQGQSAGLAEPAQEQARPAGPGRRGLPVPAGAQRAAQRLRAVHGLPLPLVDGGDRPDPDGQRHRRHPAAGFVVGPVVKRVGERGALLIGLFSGCVGFMIYGLAPTGWLYLCGLPIFAFSGLIQPGLQGLMTRRVQPWEQGQLQGANSALMGVTAIVGPSLYLFPFSWAVRHDATLHMPGLPVPDRRGPAAGATVLAIRVAHPVAWNRASPDRL